MKNLLFLYLSFFGLTTLASNKNQIILVSGESFNQKVPFAAKIWIEDKNHLSIAPVNDNLVVIKTLKAGSSTIKINEQVFWIHSLNRKQKIFYDQLQILLKSKLGLNTDIQSGEIILTGELHRFEDWLEISQIAKNNNSSYSLQVKWTPMNKAFIQQKIQSLLAENQLLVQKLLITHRLEIRLSPNSPYLMKYNNLLSSYGVVLITDSQSLDVAPTVKVQITVAEVRKNLMQQWGIQWPESYTAKLLPDQTWQKDQMTWSAAAIEQNGWGKVLASPNILCKSGKTAEFMAGGELPIKSVSYGMQNITWKSYGVLLKVSPTADDSGRISLALQTEISTIDPATEGKENPGFFKNSVSSHFDLLKSQVIALSGLIKNQHGKSTEGLPGLLNLPVLGPLFGSEKFREQQTELIIFVKPEILKLLDDETEKNQNHLMSGENE